MTTAASGGLAPLATDRDIVICCGSGGVGKTTAAAAIALEGARRGRRVVVVTIDPAKRLADALGLAGLTNEPSRIDGPWPGALWAVMLDTKSTFDDVVRRYAGDPVQAERILANRFYRNISGRLSGTQEYMAAEKLYALHEAEQFDLVVVDTPPTRNALDFLDAPRRLMRFLDHRLYRALMAPTRAYLKAVGLAAQAFLRTASKVVGGEVLNDAVAFFQAFDGMEAGFRERAERVTQLLNARETAYVLVTSPRRDSVEEAQFFAGRLAEEGLRVAALIVNRMHPSFGPGSMADAETAASKYAGTPLGPLWENLADLRQLAAGEEAQIAGLAGRVAPAPIVRVPVLHSDVHDLDGLAQVGSYLFG